MKIWKTHLDLWQWLTVRLDGAYLNPPLRLSLLVLLCLPPFVTADPSAQGKPQPPLWEVESRSPFGLVCPWPGIREVGIRWCRVVPAPRLLAIGRISKSHQEFSTGPLLTGN